MDDPTIDVDHPTYWLTKFHEAQARLTEAERIGKASEEWVRRALSAEARLAEAEAWISAVKSCADDTWECPRCGHSEDWWHGSNADHLTRAPDSACPVHKQHDPDCPACPPPPDSASVEGKK